MPSIIDFFAGIGGMSLAFRSAGFDVAGAYDIDKWAVKTYRANIGDEIEQRDICLMRGADIPRADVWTFGFPCQDVSISGKRIGMEGSRSGLFHQVMRLLDEATEQPDYLVAENVLGIEPFLPLIEQEFAARGYSMTARVYKALHFGLPQNRERYVIVGALGNCPLPRLADPAPLPYYPRMIDVLDENVPEKYIRRREVLHVRSKALEKLVRKEPIPVIAGAAYVSDCQNSRLCHPLGISNAVICSTDLKVWLGPKLWRLVTPTECGRLQGFPVDDGWKQVVSDCQAYRQFGNAVPVPMFAHVARAVAGLA